MQSRFNLDDIINRKKPKVNVLRIAHALGQTGENARITSLSTAICGGFAHAIRRSGGFFELSMGC